MFWSLDLLVPLGFIIILCGFVKSSENASSVFSNSVTPVNNDVLYPDKFSIADNKTLISYNVFISFNSGKITDKLNDLEASQMIHLATSIGCQDISSDRSHAELLDFLDSKFEYSDIDIHNLTFVISKVLSCLVNTRVNNRVIPNDQIPSSILSLILSTVSHSLGLMTHKRIEHDLDYWSAVSRVLGSNNSVNWLSNTPLNGRSYWKIKLFSERLSKDEVENLNLVNWRFGNLWAINSNFEISRLNDLMAETETNETSLVVISQNLLNKWDRNCDTYFDIFVTYSSICSYFFYINWANSGLSNEDYFRYRYKSTIDVLPLNPRCAREEKCLMYGGRLPGFNRKMNKYDSYYKGDLIKFKDDLGTDYLDKILRNIRTKLWLYDTNVNTDMIYELMKIYSTNQYEDYSSRDISDKLVSLIKEGFICNRV